VGSSTAGEGVLSSRALIFHPSSPQGGEDTGEGDSIVNKINSLFFAGEKVESA
jgi:hypothetical protein